MVEVDVLGIVIIMASAFAVGASSLWYFSLRKSNKDEDTELLKPRPVCGECTRKQETTCSICKKEI